MSLLLNTPEFSVSDISLALKQTVETSFSHVRVRGELSRVTLAKSGHLYSDLKDDSAVLNVVCWKGSVNNLSIRPEEGMEVICTGRLTTFPGSSKYQMVVESMELAGEGALLKLLEDRKKRLAAEGLFDENRKKPLPFLPKIIGVVTSPTGAVIRDIIHRVQDRFPVHIIVWPVQVQGMGASDQITKAIEGFNKVKSSNRPDLIIVARGGGSLEDLMAFNEENVVRATANSAIPIISAVGHETDTTLIDYASDMRAPTPTGAAEIALPVIENLKYQISEYDHRLIQILKRTIETYTRTITQLSHTLNNPMRMLEPLEQKMDTITHKLNNYFQTFILRLEKALSNLSGRVQTPSFALQKAEISLSNFDDRLKHAKDRVLPPKSENLINLSRMLEGLSYKNILNRGFAVIRNNDGKLLDTIQDIQDASRLEITVKDGKITKP